MKWSLLAAVYLFLSVALAGPQGARLAAQEEAVGDEPRAAMLRRELRKHIEKMDKVADRLKAPDFPKGKEWFNSPPLSLE
ncbi:MAG: hypothetical protein VYD81_04355, partial [Planctomycetota bacterium]|nr:hypothetical protein [Planctomycetota bacterium]